MCAIDVEKGCAAAPPIVGPGSPWLPFCLFPSEDTFFVQPPHVCVLRVHVDARCICIIYNGFGAQGYYLLREEETYNEETVPSNRATLV